MLRCTSVLCLSLVSLALAPPRLTAQAASAPPPPAANTFAAEPYVIEELSTVVRMKADATGTRVQTFSVRIQSESALRSFSIVAIAYPHSSEVADFVYARVRHADGSTQETSVSDALEQPAEVTREAPSYSDLQVRQLPIKDLRVGDTLAWQTRSTILHPEVPGHFWGQGAVTEGAVSLHEVMELHSPLSLHPILWTNPRSGVAFSETIAGDERVDRWSHADLHPTVGPAAEAAKLADDKRPRTPDEELDLVRGKLPSFAWTTFPDWAAVGSWYRDLSAARAQPDAAVKAKAIQLTTGMTTDLQKAQALYTYVSSQIRYIGISFGLGRYQPHTAAEVLANQFGDCKDKHTLLAALLAAVGLRADPTLIGAGIRFNGAVPSPAAFNHLISHLTLDGHEVWLDATAELSPWRALLPGLRDQQALVIPSAAPATIEHTPADLPYAPYTTSTVLGTLDATLNSDSAIVLTFHDDTEIALRSVLRSVSPSQYGAFVGNLMANLGFGGTTSDAVLDHLADASQPLAIRFHYHRTRDASWGENRITATFEPLSLPGFSPDKPPVAAIQLGTPRSETSKVEITLPPGWLAELPEEVHARSPFATCDVTFKLKDGKLLEERRLVVLQKQVPAADYKQYQAWYTAAGADGTPFVQLRPPLTATAASSHTAPPPPPPGTAVRPSDTHAAELVVSASEKLRNLDPDAARTLLDQAKAANPTERGLWLGYAAIADQFGAPREAAEDLEQELAYFPDETRLYSYLSLVQTRMGDSDAALRTDRLWVASAPTSLEAAVTLVRQLQFRKQFTEAAKEGRAAIDRLGKSSADVVPLRIAFAEAQAAGGDKPGAAAAVAPLLDTLTDPMQVNSVAYALAEGNLNLPAAETAQRRAIASLEAKTSAWSLNQSPALTARDEEGIAAAWDTLGWILYREGRYAEALNYIEPSARMTDGPDIRDHLVALAAALKQPALARATEQQRRTLPLGPAKGRHGTAQLRMLVVNGDVTELAPPSGSSAATPASASPALHDGDLILKAADLRKLLPPGSNAHLIRSGIVNCFSVVCQLVLLPLK